MPPDQEIDVIRRRGADRCEFTVDGTLWHTLNNHDRRLAQHGEPGAGGPELSFGTVDHKIRRFEPHDFDAVIDLHRRGLEQTGTDMGPGPWDDDLLSVDSLVATYITSGGEFAVGLLDDRVVSIGTLKPAGSRRGEIKRLRVQIDLQRRG
jgi:hypothetical protein